MFVCCDCNKISIIFTKIDKTGPFYDKKLFFVNFEIKILSNNSPGKRESMVKVTFSQIAVFIEKGIDQ